MLKIKDQFPLPGEEIKEKPFHVLNRAYKAEEGEDGDEDVS